MTVWSIRDLSFRYGRGAPLLFDGFSREFTPGALTIVTGPSGRGKSTLLYLMGLLLAPATGAIYHGQTNLSAMGDRQASHVRATDIGFVFQDSQLDPSAPLLDSVAEPGLYKGDTLEMWRPRAFELLESVGLSEVAMKRPGKVSGGQGQRAAAARALLLRPSLLLADEPTGNLDADNAKVVLDLLATAKDFGSTVIIATHDDRVIARADEVLAL